MRLSIVTGLVVSLLSGANALAQDAADDTEAFQGAWKLSAGEANGKELPEKQIKGGKLVIKGEHYTVTRPGGETLKGIQKLDPAKQPKTIDITDAGGPNDGKTMLGIYELKGDEYRVTFAPPGESRPTKFATAPNSGQWMNLWNRMKE